MTFESLSWHTADTTGVSEHDQISALFNEVFDDFRRQGISATQSEQTEIQPEISPPSYGGQPRQSWYISQHNDGPPASWFACGPTSLLMALADYGLQTPDEGTRQRVIDETGTRRAGQYPGGVQLMADHARQYGLRSEHLYTRDARDVDAAIKEGKAVIVNGALVRNTGHFVYISGKDEHGRYILGDPAYPQRTTWTHDELQKFMSTHTHPGFAAVWRT